MTFTPEQLAAELTNYANAAGYLLDLRGNGRDFFIKRLAELIAVSSSWPYTETATPLVRHSDEVAEQCDRDNPCDTATLRSDIDELALAFRRSHDCLVPNQRLLAQEIANLAQLLFDTIEVVHRGKSKAKRKKLFHIAECCHEVIDNVHCDPADL